MLTRLAQHWWVYALRGMVAILFGIAAFGSPHPTIAVLVAQLARTRSSRGYFSGSARQRAGAKSRIPGSSLPEGLIGVVAGVLGAYAIAFASCSSHSA